LCMDFEVPFKPDVGFQKQKLTIVSSREAKRVLSKSSVKKIVRVERD